MHTWCLLPVSSTVFVIVFLVWLVGRVWLRVRLGATVSVVPLKGSNYATWKVQAKMSLRRITLEDSGWYGVSTNTPANAVAAYNSRKDIGFVGRT